MLDLDIHEFGKIQVQNLDVLALAHIYVTKIGQALDGAGFVARALAHDDVAGVSLLDDLNDRLGKAHVRGTASGHGLASRKIGLDEHGIAGLDVFGKAADGLDPLFDHLAQVFLRTEQTNIAVRMLVDPHENFPL